MQLKRTGNEEVVKPPRPRNASSNSSRLHLGRPSKSDCVSSYPPDSEEEEAQMYSIKRPRPLDDDDEGRATKRPRVGEPQKNTGTSDERPRRQSTKRQRPGGDDNDGNEGRSAKRPRAGEPQKNMGTSDANIPDDWSGCNNADIESVRSHPPFNNDDDAGNIDDSFSDHSVPQLGTAANYTKPKTPTPSEIKYWRKAQEAERRARLEAYRKAQEEYMRNRRAYKQGRLYRMPSPDREQDDELTERGRYDLEHLYFGDRFAMERRASPESLGIACHDVRRIRQVFGQEYARKFLAGQKAKQREQERREEKGRRQLDAICKQTFGDWTTIWKTKTAEPVADGKALAEDEKE